MNCRKMLFFSLIALFIFTNLANAEWKSFSSRSQNIKVSVIEATSSHTVFELDLAGYYLYKVKADGRNCNLITVPGSVGRLRRGKPLLPQLGQLFRIPKLAKATIEVIAKEEIEIDLPYPILPSKGHLTRNINPKSIPYHFGDIYYKNSWYPAEKKQVRIGNPFSSWDIRGVQVRILPVRYNPVEKKARIIKSITLKISYARRLRRLRRFWRRIPRRRRRIFRRLLRNFKGFAPQATRSVDNVAENERSTLVAAFQNITFKNTIGQAYQDWKNWKAKCGYDVVEVYADGKNASALKEDIWQKSPSAIVLFGDANGSYENATPMPTFQGASSGYPAWDRKYACQSDPYLNDALFSRISGSEAECASQLNKIRQYEQAGSNSSNSIAIGVSSYQGTPADNERIQWLMTGGGEYSKWITAGQGLKDQLYPTFETYFADYSNSSQVNSIKTTLNSQGCGSMWYIGHGSSTSWVSTGFNCSDAKSLSNGGNMPFIFSVACVNGDFMNTSECFAEAWLRNANGGAVAMEASSTNEAWVPPCIKQVGTAQALISGERCYGELEKAGLLLAKQYYSGDSSYAQLAEQCNIFGDCTLIVKTQATRNIDVQVSKSDDYVTFNISTGATISVYNNDFSFAFTATSENGGNVKVPLAGASSDLYYTIIGADITPIIDAKLE